MSTIEQLQTKPQSTILVVTHGENRTRWYMTQDGDLLTADEAQNADDLAYKVMADDWYPGTMQEWRESVKSRALGVLAGTYNPMTAGMEIVDFEM